ncbi:MAG: chorismate synthase [Candidatus Cryptobacteroides sp.]
MNSFGKSSWVSILGESHGTEIGIVVDGVKAGICLGTEDLMADILRRKFSRCLN